jgi:hypothetical protein
MSKWALSADRSGLLPELQWTTIRYKIILQVCIFLDTNNAMILILN